MIKTCSRCGGTFDLHGLAKYCVPCRREIKNEYNRQYRHTTEKYLRVERVRRCEICGQKFEAKTCAKYCPACRKEAYKTVKPKLKPQELRLATLRKKLTQAQTPETRRKYFREYVLLKQELSRGQYITRSD